MTDAGGIEEISDISVLLERPDLFEMYRANVQARREANRLARLRAYWQRAIEQLTEEMAGALADGDSEIAEELTRIVAAFQAALASSAPPSSIAAPAPAEPNVAVADEGVETDLAALAIDIASDTAVPTFEIDETRQRELTEAVATLCANPCLATNGRRADLPTQMRARALYCRARAILPDPNLAEADCAALKWLIGEIGMGVNGDAAGFPFTLARTSSDLWQTLADSYDQCASACEGLAWYADHLDDIGPADRTRLLNAIAATQKRLFRLQEQFGGIDRCQNEFFKRIMDLKDYSVGWLLGLDPNTSDQELRALTDGFEATFNEIQAGVSAQAVRQARKDAAIQAVIDWEDALEGRAVTTATLGEDQMRLSALLDECLAAGVPPTNVKVRSAILETASVLLDGLPKYAKFLEAALMERKRKGLDDVAVEAAMDEPVPDTEFEAMRRSVAAFTRGKTILILGGKTRTRVRQELSQILECDVSWPDSESADKPGKFEPAIKKSDIVLLNKNFCRHGTFYLAKDLAGESGRHFIVLPSGYGVRQVVSQVQEYIARGDRA